MCEESGDPLSLSVRHSASLVPREEPEERDDSVSEIRISNIKTEQEEIIDVEDDNKEKPSQSQGHLLRSVLQGKAGVTMYSRGPPVGFNTGMNNSFGVKPFSCNICNKSFAYNYLLKRHGRVHKAERNTCAYCHKSFTAHTDLLTHVNHYIGGLPNPYTCDHCQQEFPCRTSYTVHDNCRGGGGIHRNNPGIGEASEHQFHCLLCGVTFASQVMLRFHMRKDHQHYSCHKCNKTFSNGVALSNHLRGHCTGSGKKKCGVCARNFPNMSLLMRHRRTHFKNNAPASLIKNPVQNTAQNPVQEHVQDPGQEPAQETAQDPAQRPVQDAFQIEGQFRDQPEEVIVKAEPPSPMQDIDVEEMAGKEEAEELESRGGPHSCSVCSETFTSQAALRFHLKGIHMQYHCHRCPKVYSSGLALSNHLRSHSLQGDVKRHRCLTCLKTFDSLHLLTRHKRVHSTPGMTMATRQTRMQEALAEGQSADDRTCSTCGMVAVSRSALERHMGCHMTRKMFTCHVCNLSMGYASSLQKHLRKTHGIMVELRSIQKDVFTDAEPAEEVTVDGAEESHTVGEETGEVVQVNDEGQAAPASPEKGITVKQETADGDDLGIEPVDNSRLPFECKTCHARFQYRSVLLRHINVHNRPQNIACPICMKTFSEVRQLNNHKGVHTRYKNYPCVICGKSFNGINAWQQHQRLHQKGYIYSCKLCGKKFMSKADLLEHKKMHIKVRIFTCGVCKNSYHSSSALSKHKRKNGHYGSTVEGEIEVDSPQLEISDDAFSDVEVVVDEMMPAEEKPVEKLAEEQAQQVQDFPQHFLAPEPLSFKESFYPSGRRRPTCDFCNAVFTRWTELKEHKRMHMKRGYMTPVTSTATESKEAESKDLLENMCPICFRTFSDNNSLTRHKGWHTRRSGLGLPDVLTLPPPEANLETVASATTAEPNREASLGADPDLQVVDEVGKPQTLTIKTEAAQPMKVGSVCPHCHNTFATNAALANHIKVHENRPRMPTCSKCHKSFSTNAALANHVKIHIHYCARCNINFANSSALTKHLKSHMDRGTGDVFKDPTKSGADPDLSPQRKLACKICRKPFQSKKALITHIGWHSRSSRSHKILVNPFKQPGPVSPPPSVMFPSQPMENEKVEDSFTCDVCQKVFSSAMALTQHRKLHTRHFLSSSKAKFNSNAVSLSMNNAHFPCPICGRVFKMKKYLDLHMEIHSSDRRFKCNQCPQAYQNAGSLWKHKRTQHSFKLFSCPICQMRYGIKSQLMQHMKSHNISEEFLNSNQTVYSCGICSKAFGRQDKLRQHEKTHQV